MPLYLDGAGWILNWWSGGRDDWFISSLTLFLPFQVIFFPLISPSNDFLPSDIIFGRFLLGNSLFELLLELLYLFLELSTEISCLETLFKSSREHWGWKAWKAESECAGSHREKKAPPLIYSVIVQWDNGVVTPLISPNKAISPILASDCS